MELKYVKNCNLMYINCTQMYRKHFNAQHVEFINHFKIKIIKTNRPNVILYIVSKFWKEINLKKNRKRKKKN